MLLIIEHRALSLISLSRAKKESRYTFVFVKLKGKQKILTFIINACILRYYKYDSACRSLTTKNFPGISNVFYPAEKTWPFV